MAQDSPDNLIATVLVRVRDGLERGKATKTVPNSRQTGSTVLSGSLVKRLYPD